MNIQSIETDADHRAALREIESLMTALPDTPEGKKFDALTTLVEAYEREQYPLMPPPDPAATLKTEQPSWHTP